MLPVTALILQSKEESCFLESLFSSQPSGKSFMKTKQKQQANTLKCGKMCSLTVRRHSPNHCLEIKVHEVLNIN